MYVPSLEIYLFLAPSTLPYTSALLFPCVSHHKAMGED